MQLTLEVVIGWIGGAAMGAMVAWLGNRVVYAELWGHVRKHCGEIETATKRLDAHSRALGRLRPRVAVLSDRAGLRMEDED